MISCFIRSVIFTIAFYIATFLCCVLFTPFFIMPARYGRLPAEMYLNTIYWLEFLILDLDLTVRGIENLPKEGAFIVAAKHQSRYETFKLHLLFNNPAIILKKELLSLPLFGTYLKKIDAIAIDRKSGREASTQIIDGAKRMKDVGRPIIIFPQGTRVGIEDDKPYKVGVANIQQATDLPIIPMALNAGFFYPKKGFLKKRGTVIFEFLPPLKPQKDKKALVKTLKNQVDSLSTKLIDEARAEQIQIKEKLRRRHIRLGAIFAVLFALYSASWIYTAQKTEEIYQNYIGQPTQDTDQNLEIKGFPFAIQAISQERSVKSNGFEFSFDRFNTYIWPVPFIASEINFSGTRFKNENWKKEMTFQSLEVTAAWNPLQNTAMLYEASLYDEDFKGSITGDVSLNPDSDIDLLLKVKEVNHLLRKLQSSDIITPEMVAPFNFALLMMQKDDHIILPVTTKEGTLYLGPIPLGIFKPREAIDTKKE